jgi:hypothetical protein
LIAIYNPINSQPSTHFPNINHYPIAHSEIYHKHPLRLQHTKIMYSQKITQYFIINRTKIKAGLSCFRASGLPLGVFELADSVETVCDGLRYFLLQLVCSIGNLELATGLYLNWVAHRKRFHCLVAQVEVRTVSVVSRTHRPLDVLVLHDNLFFYL